MGVFGRLSTMEWHQVTGKLDSLWFFGTVFSNAMEEKLGNRNATLNDDVEPFEEEIATPSSQNDRQVENGGSVSEIKTEVEIRVTQSKEMEKEEKRRRSRRRKSSCFRQRRKILGEMDLSFALKEVCECWGFEQRIGGQNYQKKKNMPPFEDNMAMKEHIKWWAYAVACTVR